MERVLQVADLRVDIPVHGKTLHAVRGISFDVNRGETLCIVGESGCGKSLTAMSLMSLLPRSAKVSAQALTLQGEDILNAKKSRLASLRGNRISMVFQEPMTALNPSYTIGNQLIEVYRRHKGSAAKGRERAIELLEKVGISAAAERLNQYPHQLSGGLRQRVMIAMALMCEPSLLLADEPTTALDVTIQAQILRLIKELQKELELAVVLITHDLGVVARIADHVAVMYAGKIVEKGPAKEIFARPQHPYTEGLFAAIPIPGSGKDRLGSIPGTVPSLIGGFTGCAFRQRCQFADEMCLSEPPLFAAGGQSVACWLRSEETTSNAREARS